MKVWFLEQTLRQLELDVHRNNTELLMMKSQPPQSHMHATRYNTQRKRKNEYMNNANPSLRMPNISHNRDHTLCDQIDDFLQPTRNDETFMKRSLVLLLLSVVLPPVNGVTSCKLFHKKDK
jgi:hypothetical protein